MATVFTREWRYLEGARRDEILSERRRYEERVRGLFREGRERGELRTDLDDAAAVLLVLGDSISASYGLAKGEGWVDLLAARLEEKGYRERVVNASISGDTTAGGRARLPALLREHRPSIVVIELDMKFGSVDIRLPDGASASIDDVEVVVGSARDHRKDAPAEGSPHVILTGRTVCGSVDVRGPRKSLFGRG